jgi:ADP-ribosyl cyclase
LAAATQYAEENGLTTLEMTPNGALAAESGSAISSQTWTALSGQFAQAASGTVNVFINTAAFNEAGTFATTELPILLENGANIIWHFF